MCVYVYVLIIWYFYYGQKAHPISSLSLSLWPSARKVRQLCPISQTFSILLLFCLCISWVAFYFWQWINMEGFSFFLFLCFLPICCWYLILFVDFSTLRFTQPYFFGAFSLMFYYFGYKIWHRKYVYIVQDFVLNLLLLSVLLLFIVDCCCLLNLMWFLTFNLKSHLYTSEHVKLYIMINKWQTKFYIQVMTNWLNLNFFSYIIYNSISLL